VNDNSDDYSDDDYNTESSESEISEDSDSFEAETDTEQANFLLHYNHNDSDMIVAESAHSSTSAMPETVVNHTRKSKKNGKQQPLVNDRDDREPGDSLYPITSWSLTVAKTGGDINLSLLAIFEQFLITFCVRGKNKIFYYCFVLI